MMTATEKPKIQCLSIGLSPEFKQAISSILTKLDNTDLDYDIDKLLDLTGINPSIVFCAPPPADISPVEVAQMLRMKYPNVLIYFLADINLKLDRKNFIKNGYTDAFFFPLDLDYFTKELENRIQGIGGQDLVFRPVKMLDIDSGVALNFETYIYLPANNRHIKFSDKGQEIASKRLGKLKSHSVNSLFVSQAEMPEFYKHTAQVLKKLGTDPGISETEKAEKLKNAVRGMVTELFNDSVTGTDAGKKIVEDCQNIVKSYISTGKSGKIYNQLLCLSGNAGGTYDGIANVSTYASLFAIGLGLKTVDEIALAGLLIDVGMAKVPAEIQKKSKSLWSSEEKAIYEQHPDFSIEIIRDRKLVLSDLIFKIVQQHHERYDGAGFPKKLAGNRICVEAQILNFADAFNQMTTSAPGKISLRPEEAVEFFRQSLSNPGSAMIDPELMKRILSLFSVETSAAKAS